METSEHTLPAEILACMYCGCGFNSSHVAQLVCGCCYCSGCLEKMFAGALSDVDQREVYRQLPRCCIGPIPFEVARRHLSKQLVTSYEARRVELETLDRTYCHHVACGKFIAPHSIHNGQAFCQKCQAQTCSKCKDKWHFGPCWGGELKRILEMGKNKDWRQCPGCKTMVERLGGCPHMSCPCGCDFCYLCGQIIPCSCTGDEDRYYEEQFAAPADNHHAEPEPLSIQEVHVRGGHSDYANVSRHGRGFICAPRLQPMQEES